MKLIAAVILGVCILLAFPARGRGEASTAEVLNFALLDSSGKLHELRRLEAKAVVLFFTANGCPVARLSAPKLTELNKKFGDLGVTFFLLNANSADDRQSIAKEAAELKLGRLAVLKDDTQGVARHLGVKRTCEAIAISTKDWTVFYRGAIDDQLTEGTQKPQPTERYLETALHEFLAGKQVTQPKTMVRGCLINFDGGEGPNAAAVSYAKDVAPLLSRKCIHCHCEDNIGSWNMTDHAHIKSMAAMIEEVILTRRMPPWDADSQHGKFANDASLQVAEAQTLLRWIHQGAPRGEGPDLLTTANLKPAEDWPLGQPDIIVRLPEPEQIPATGVLEYRHIEALAGNASEGWVGGVWIKPGNRKVLHHVIARLKNDAEGKKSPEERDSFAGWAPGSTQGWFPQGTGKFLPAGAKFDIEMHYTPNGAAQTDQTEIGLYLLPEQPAKRLASIAAYNRQVEIQPGDAAAETFAIYGFKRDATLYNVAPHMHLRGRWMTFELLRPDGRRETICSVPRYDFNWQQKYQLATPLKIPAGAWMLVTGGYDNSPLNPANPNPHQTVRWGDQSFEEMFTGFMGVTWDEEPLRQATAKQ
jgi:peroxiredoxin